MRRIAACLSVVSIALLLFSGCAEPFGATLMALFGAVGDDRADVEEIFAFVTENEEQLRTAIQEGDYSSFENQGVIKEIDEEENCVDFYCGGVGMGSSTGYVGFFYTPDNNMTAMWCAPSSEELLTPYEDGFEWREEKGDNRYYTQQICQNFYYYEASY